MAEPETSAARPDERPQSAADRFVRALLAAADKEGLDNRQLAARFVALLPTTYRADLGDCSADIAELAAALAAAQGSFAPVRAGRTAEVKAKDNPTKTLYTYNYADLASLLEACRGALSTQGLALVQRTASPTRLETTLLHSSGQWLRSYTPIVVSDGKGPQAFGSALTYARRYGILSLLGLASEDDDGAGAGGASPPQKRPAPTAPPRPQTPPDAEPPRGTPGDRAQSLLLEIQSFKGDRAAYDQLKAAIVAAQLPPKLLEAVREAWITHGAELFGPQESAAP